MEDIKKNADVIVLAAPHSAYKSLDWSDKVLVDVLNYYGQGGLV
jgi:predicted dinucleotide-binding enzyme